MRGPSWGCETYRE